MMDMTLGVVQGGWDLEHVEKLRGHGGKVKDKHF